MIVYDFSTFSKGVDPLYDCSRYVIETVGKVNCTLYLLYYDHSRHFHPILNFVGASGMKGFCKHCHKGINLPKNHKCPAKCVKCLQTPWCEAKNDLVKCRECCREFFGDDCYLNHLKEKSFDSNSTVCMG